MRRLLVACAATIAIVALVSSAHDDLAEPIPVATGTIYSTDAGDPLDVVVDVDEAKICMNVGAFGYGSSASCTDEEAASSTGSYVVVFPTSRTGPAYAVGVLPAAAVGATVDAGGEERRAETRGRWFLIQLPELSRDDASDVAVDFYT